MFVDNPIEVYLHCSLWRMLPVIAPVSNKAGNHILLSTVPASYLPRGRPSRICAFSVWFLATPCASHPGFWCFSCSKWLTSIQPDWCGSTCFSIVLNRLPQSVFQHIHTKHLIMPRTDVHLSQTTAMSSVLASHTWQVLSSLIFRLVRFISSTESIVAGLPCKDLHSTWERRQPNKVPWIRSIGGAATCITLLDNSTCQVIVWPT